MITRLCVCVEQRLGRISDASYVKCSFEKKTKTNRLIELYEIRQRAEKKN